jgi:hypothetical protein
VFSKAMLYDSADVYALICLEIILCMQEEKVQQGRLSYRVQVRRRPEGLPENVQNIAICSKL